MLNVIEQYEDVIIEDYSDYEVGNSSLKPLLKIVKTAASRGGMIVASIVATAASNLVVRYDSGTSAFNLLEIKVPSPATWTDVVLGDITQEDVIAIGVIESLKHIEHLSFISVDAEAEKIADDYFNNHAPEIEKINF